LIALRARGAGDERRRDGDREKGAEAAEWRCRGEQVGSPKVAAAKRANEYSTAAPLATRTDGALSCEAEYDDGIELEFRRSDERRDQGRISIEPTAEAPS